MTGHAGYAKHGSDIICAGVSALAINTVNSIDVLTDDKGTANVDENTGTLTFYIDGKASDKSVLLIDSLILGLKGIMKEYGSENYLQILFKEV